jgi:hypothetical protein
MGKLYAKNLSTSILMNLIMYGRSIFMIFAMNIVIHHMENSFQQFKEYPTNDNKKVRFFASLKAFHARDSCTISRRLLIPRVMSVSTS